MLKFHEEMYILTPFCFFFFSVNPSDGSWYRGIVQSLEGDGNANVYFVDYGNTRKVQAAHLRAIKPSLLKLPFQAICCWLAGISCVCVFLCLSMYLAHRLYQHKRNLGVAWEIYILLS